MMRQKWILAGVAVAAGFLGGALSNGVSAFAQERTRQITAERFVVVDAAGRKRGELGLDAQGQINLKLYNEEGRTLWWAPIRAGIFPAGPTQ
jgi:hypothetical protein